MQRIFMFGKITAQVESPLGNLPGKITNVIDGL
jgi:hypothetical protein